jgi:hypothetical protein
MACQFSQVGFSGDLPTGRLGSCEQTSDGHYLLTIGPENEPINPSPWYHFTVTAKVTTLVPIILAVEGANPRYIPKYSNDGIHWQTLPFDTQDNQLVFNVPVDAGQSVQISAQAPITNDAYKVWLDGLVANNDELTLDVLGQSAQGRNILSLTHTRPGNTEWLLVIGRQHPPEVTGAIGLMRFTEQVLTHTPLSEEFLSRFNVLWVPDLNPDGVAMGNWRHTSAGVDLNRDWKLFNQPESRLVRDKLAAITAAGGKIAFALDFHSTYYDIFYAMPEDYPLAPADFTTAWLANLQDYTKGLFKVSVKPGSNPDNGVFKQFIADTYQVPAVTYEMGDNTPPIMIDYIARAAAKTLMGSMLTYSPDAYIYKKD